MSKNLISLGQSAINAGGGLLSTILANKANREENEKTREYNLKLAQMQNQWNREQWQRENAYNNPSAQLQRLKDAGINADLIYGGGIANTSTSSPMMTAGAAATPTSLVGMPNVVGDYLDAQLKQAQIDNINADTQKKGSEASVLASDAKYRDAYNEGLIQTQNVQIEVSQSARDLNQANAAKALRETQAIDASVAQINKSIESIDQNMKIQEKLSEAQLKQIAADVGLTYEQINRMAQETPKILRNLDDKHSLDLLGIGRLEIDNGVAKFQAEMHGAFNDTTEREMRFSDQCLKGLTRLIDAFRGNPFTSADLRK